MPSFLMIQERSYTYCFYKKPVKGHSTESFLIYCDFSTESFLFGFLSFYIAERITVKAVLTSFIKHMLLTLVLAHRGLLMGRIKKNKEKNFVTWAACMKI